MGQFKHIGELSADTSRPGILVRCTRLPSQRFYDLWKSFLLKGWDFTPQVNERYVVRGNAFGPSTFIDEYRRGVLLASCDGAKQHRNPFVSSPPFEPYFPFSCFVMEMRTGRP